MAAQGAQKTQFGPFRRAEVANQLRQSLPGLEVEEKFVDETSGYILDIRASDKAASAGMRP